MSGDRDLIQVVRDPKVKLLFTIKGVSELLGLDEAGVLDSTASGVALRRVRDPARRRERRAAGVRGVGEKTARELVNAYGSLGELPTTPTRRSRSRAC